MTIRSKAAKTIEKISGIVPFGLIKIIIRFLTTNQRFINFYFQKNSKKKCFFHSGHSWKDILILSSTGKKSKSSHGIYNFDNREAAILVLGVISGFKHEFKSIEPQLK